jgi:hypothetical protein
MNYLVLLVLVFAMSGCLNTTRKEQVFEQERTIYTGSVGTSNINLTVLKDRKETTTATGGIIMDVPNIEAGLNLLSIIAPLLSGGGIGGVIAVIITTLIKNWQIKEITEGVEEYLKDPANKEQESLKKSLSKKMSKNTKQVVRKLKP